MHTNPFLNQYDDDDDDHWSTIPAEHLSASDLAGLPPEVAAFVLPWIDYVNSEPESSDDAYDVAMNATTRFLEEMDYFHNEVSRVY